MNNKHVIKKLCKFSFVNSIIAVCTLGVCPPFGAMAIAVPIVLKNKKVKLDEKTEKMNKKSLILGIISLVLFVIDVIIAAVLQQKGFF